MNKTTRTGLLAAGLAFGMVGVGYASVPLYRLFCQVTGFAGTTQKAIGTSAPGAVAGKTMSVRFDANHAPNLPWTFAPEAKREVVTLGAQLSEDLLGIDQRLRAAEGDEADFGC